MRILSSHAKWCCITVMLLVNILVEDSMMQASVQPVVPCVLHNKEDGQLKQDLLERRKGEVERHANLGTQRVEKPNRECFDHEVRDQNRLETLPLFFVARDFIVLNLELLEIWYPVNDGPRQAPAEIHDLVCQKEE